MDVQFITSVAMITPDPVVSRGLYVDALGLPLTAEGDGYLHSEDIDGCKSFGIWPLTQAAQACFGTPDWPAERPVPQASIEFEVADPHTVQAAADELKEKGFIVVAGQPRARPPPHGRDQRRQRQHGRRVRGDPIGRGAAQRAAAAGSPPPAGR